MNSVGVEEIAYGAGDLAACSRFYIDRLGSRPAEHIGDGGYFMQAPGSTEYYNLLLENFGENHYRLQNAALD